MLSVLTPDEIALITRHGIEHRYPRKHLVCVEGAPGDAVYFIMDGEVRVYVGNEDGRESTLAVLRAGEHFGELALFLEEKRTASVMTQTPARLVHVTRERFQQCLREHPELVFKLLTGFAARVDALTGIVKDLALNDVYGRVANLLNRLAIERDGLRVVTPTLSHQEIANRAGCSREMVSRIFKDLRVGGYLDVADGEIRLLNKLPHAW